MITGDYPVTAINIAKEIGLKNPDQCITGQELKEMSEEELAEDQGCECFCQGHPGAEAENSKCPEKERGDRCNDR